MGCKWWEYNRIIGEIGSKISWATEAGTMDEDAPCVKGDCHLGIGWKLIIK